MTPHASGEAAGGANNDFPKFAPGDNADKVLSATYQNKLIAGVERANRMTFGPGSDVIQFGPFSLKKRLRAKSSSLDLAFFVITDPDCTEQTATAVVTAVGCSTSSVSVGDSIDLVDEMGCHIVGAEELLIGRTGCATRISGGPYGCQWAIMTLCPDAFTC